MLKKFFTFAMFLAVAMAAVFVTPSPGRSQSYFDDHYGAFRSYPYSNRSYGYYAPQSAYPRYFNPYYSRQRYYRPYTGGYGYSGSYRPYRRLGAYPSGNYWR
jgi:hypothetical protein